jgi:hypothetical protein
MRQWQAARLRSPLGTGRGTGGQVWELRAWGSPEWLSTHLQVSDERGGWHSGGSGGPALDGGRRLALHGHAGYDGAPSRLVIRVAADVESVWVWLSDGSRNRVRLHGDAAQLGARIGALVFTPHLDYRRVDLFGANGESLPETLLPESR